jgi:integrase
VNRLALQHSLSSVLNESGLWNANAIERQLAHVDSDSVRLAYARADFWEERVAMIAYWARVFAFSKPTKDVVALRSWRQFR